MLRGVMNLQTCQQPSRLGRLEGFIQRRRFMGVEVVHHQDERVGLRRVHINHVTDHMRKVDRGAAVRDRHLPLPRQRLEDHEQIGRAFPLVFVIDPRQLPWGGGNRHARFRHQWLARLLQTHDWPLRVVGAWVDFQHVLHGTNKLGVGFRRNHPLLLLPWLEIVFFSVVRTHSRPIVSTTSSSTSRSASNWSVPRARPSGGVLHVKAISRASCAPSTLRYCRPVGRCRSRAAAKPSSTKACRTRWTLEMLVSTASAISRSLQSGPPSLASALSRIRARVRTEAARRPVDISAVNCVRSSAVSRTMYLAILIPPLKCSQRRTYSRKLVNSGRLRH